MNRRIGDQVLVLDAIRSVRSELNRAKDESSIVTGEILVRLVTLYSLLNVEQLKDIAEQADDRMERKVA